MASFKWVGDLEEVCVPGVGNVTKGEPVEIPAELVDGLNPDQWDKSTKKAAKVAVDTPAGEGESA